MFADILKERTLVAHASLEKKLVVHIKNVRSTSDYVDLLLLLYPFHYRATELLSEYTFELPVDRHDPARAGNIRNDLEHFGSSVDNQPVDSLPIPRIHSKEDALGICYVLEGSTMGGQIITRILSKAMGVSPDAGFSFFNPYRDNTHSKWQEFKSHLNSNAEQLDQQQVINAATDFFNCYNQWIQLNEPVRY